MSEKIVEGFKKNSVLIIGERIYLKIMREENATTDYANWLNDSEVNQYMETRSVTIQELKNYIKEKFTDDNCLFFGIFLKLDNRHIGNIKLELIDWQKKTADFGVLLGAKDCWGKGLATEAAKLIVDFSFKKLNLAALELGLIADNHRAFRVFEKIGFKVNEIKKGTINHDGRRYDEITMTIEK